MTRSVLNTATSQPTGSVSATMKKAGRDHYVTFLVAQGWTSWIVVAEVMDNPFMHRFYP